MMSFREKLSAAGAFVRDLRRRAWVVPESMTGLSEYLPELRGIADENRKVLDAGGPRLAFPQVQVEGRTVTLILVDALAILAPLAGAREQSTRREIAWRRRAIARDGFDTVLRAALVRKYGLRIRREG
jgi:hypothetical protein